MKKIDHTLVYDYDVLGDGQVPEDVIKAITVPTLVMNGEKSMDFMHASAARMASLVPDGRHTTIKGQAHGVTADATVPVLVEFFGRDQ